MTQEEEKLLIKIAEMYYLENKTQNEISKELNIHRTTISRLLKQSREKGVVKISINRLAAGPHMYEEELIKKYQLKDAVVVDINGNKRDVLNMLGKAANNYLKGILEDDMIIGFSWGSALSAFVRSIEGIDKNNIICVPMVGGPAGRSKSDYHVNTITYEASQNLRGKALLIDAPALPETVELKKALMANSFNQTLTDHWKKLDIAIMGIGSPTMKGSERWKFFYGEDIFQILEENQIAGDVVSRFYDVNGIHVQNVLDDRIIGIEMEDLKKVRYKIGIAESISKVSAIRGALLGGYVNILVTTVETADALLKD